MPLPDNVGMARHDNEPVLVINDGTLPALLVSLMTPNAAKVTAWVPLGGDVTSVRRQREALGYGAIVDSDESPDVSAMLLAAVHEAANRGVVRVLWPVYHGTDLDGLYETAERAALVTRLAALDRLGSMVDTGTPMSPEVEYPFADLGVLELAELAVDLDVPDGLARTSPELSAAIQKVRESWIVEDFSAAAAGAA